MVMLRASVMWMPIPRFAPPPTSRAPRKSTVKLRPETCTMPPPPRSSTNRFLSARVGPRCASVSTTSLLISPKQIPNRLCSARSRKKRQRAQGLRSADLALFRALVHHMRKIGVDARVIGQFRMEGRSQQVSLPNADDLILESAEHLHVRGDLGDVGRANEDAAHRRRVRLAVGRKREVGLEAIHLPPEGVAGHAHIHEA